LNGCISQKPDFVWAYLFRSFANEKLQAADEAEADFHRRSSSIRAKMPATCCI